ncbi:MAG: polyprenyl synthetase solanesyl diphosphate synthase [Lachnospiraceae bacterium]|nr:polyprenyl synthetase solanesyl diphosphate synthase [Lachnospiraceae bacterium]
MKKRTLYENSETRMFDVQGLQAYLSLGRSRAVEFAKAAGAERRFGKRCLYDRRVIDAALDNLEG